jgi:FAD/FMN-containing dehydrogenase
MPTESAAPSTRVRLWCFACRDWLGKYKGSTRVALKPKTTEQAAAILRHCNARRLAVVPQAS